MDTTVETLQLNLSTCMQKTNQMYEKKGKHLFHILSQESFIYITSSLIFLFNFCVSRKSLMEKRNLNTKTTLNIDISFFRFVHFVCTASDVSVWYAIFLQVTSSPGLSGLGRALLESFTEQGDPVDQRNDSENGCKNDSLSMT